MSYRGFKISIGCDVIIPYESGSIAISVISIDDQGYITGIINHDSTIPKPSVNMSYYSDKKAIVHVSHVKLIKKPTYHQMRSTQFAIVMTLIMQELRLTNEEITALMTTKDKHTGVCVSMFVLKMLDDGQSAYDAFNLVTSILQHTPN